MNDQLWHVVAPAELRAGETRSQPPPCSILASVRPSRAWQADVATCGASLERMIALFRKDGGIEWAGMQETTRLRDAADNDNRSRLQR